MTDAATKANEIRAANVVRRLIQKVRVATPDNIDALEAEVFEVFEQQVEAMGSQHGKVQEEVDKGLTIARTRVQQIQEQRDKDAEKARRPKELMNEISELLESFQCKLANLKSAACFESNGAELHAEEAEDIKKMADELAAEIIDFSQQCATRATEIKQSALPPRMNADWAKLSLQVSDVAKDAHVAVASARAATVKVTEAVRKQKLEDRQAELRERVKEVTVSVPSAEHCVITAETQVAAFLKPKKEESVMLALADEVDEAVAVARSSIESAREEMKQPITLGYDDDDEPLRKELEKFIATETKRPAIRFGQFERRLVRVTNIVRGYRNELRENRNKSVLDSLKADLLERVKENATSEAWTLVEPALKEVEKMAEPCGKHKNMTFSEMSALAEKLSTAVDTAKDSFASANHEMCPIDESLDEDVKRKLRSLVAPHIKQPMLRLGQMERRLKRVSNILSTLRSELEKKRDSEQQKVRQSVLKMLRKHMVATELDAEALFVSFGAVADHLSQDAFVSFFDGLDTTVKKNDSEEEEQVELPSEDLVSFFASLSNGADALSKDSFLQLVCPRMKVLKATALTSVLSITDGKLLRSLKPGETLEALEAPVKEGNAGVMRVRVKTQKDDKIGWATVAGNAGTIFLKEI
mmetsp:Transcript_43911/g.121520  ORF Transcript_43911/g.121520 Transcript_43911/m.121520 type:complete len:643 (+) Transcript_43911:60-1988(+)